MTLPAAVPIDGGGIDSRATDGGITDSRATNSRAISGSPSRKEQTRSRLLEAAKEVFEEKGFLPSTVADIVNRAGVAHGTFYNYYPSREDILREVAMEADERLHAPMNEVILRRSSDDPPARRIREAVGAFLAAYRDEARIMRVVEEVSHYDHHVRAARLERHRRWQAEMADSIRGLQRHGLADPSLDPTVTCAILGSVAVRFPEMWLVDQMVDCSFDDAVDHVVKIFIKALGLSETSG